MSDSEGRRYQVFVQEQHGAPHRDAGTVHAPDGELALLNARDVFVRRPSCVSLWVVPIEAILFLTAEQLAGGLPHTPVHAHQPYHVFAKERPAGALSWLATFGADSPAAALRQALLTYTNRLAPSFWAVFPAQAVIASSLQEAASLFEPAADKGFRSSTHFHTHTVMRRLLKTNPQEPAEAVDAAGEAEA